MVWIIELSKELGNRIVLYQLDELILELLSLNERSDGAAAERMLIIWDEYKFAFDSVVRDTSDWGSLTEDTFAINRATEAEKRI